MRVYGIKNCGSVKKALDFLESKKIDYEFIDLKKVKLDKGELESWLKSVSLEELFNKKGTTYKKLNLKELDLNEAEIKEWLLKEQMLIKRPVIVCKKGVLVGFDLEKYAEFFNA